MKDCLIKEVRVWKLNAELTQPFAISHGQHDQAENVLIRLDLSNGVSGFGEAACAPHITGETQDGTLASLRACGQWLVGKPAELYRSLCRLLAERLQNNRCALAGLEMALLDALTRCWNVPLYRFFGGAGTRIETDMTVTVGSVEEAGALTRQILKKGIRKLKVKVGRDFDLDLLRVRRIHQMAPRCEIVLDANQAFDPGRTMLFLKKVRAFGVRPALFEQPVPKADWEGLKWLGKHCPVPVCADESASNFLDVSRIVREKAVPAVNIKLMKFGLLEAAEAASLCRAAGIQLMIGGMLESRLAMTAGAHLAAGMGCFQFVDLDTPYFFKKDPMRGPGLKSNGVYDLKPISCGIGVVPRHS
ncbi:MAG: dipeptide epimerase [Elusimicrobia bacterium]|nr:dipeptide epimerase [Elusimicrobiota bacterium]